MKKAGRELPKQLISAHGAGAPSPPSERLAFLVASATGGARKPNPSEGAEAAPPQAAELQK